MANGSPPLLKFAKEKGSAHQPTDAKTLYVQTTAFTISVERSGKLAADC